MQSWLATFASANAFAAALLVDRHDPDGIAFTTIEVDGESIVSADLTYGELADHSKGLATALAELGIERGDTVGC